MARVKQNRRCCPCAHAARAKYKLKLVESLDKKLARIRRSMNEWNSEFQLKREIELLEHVLSGKIELQKKNAAKLSKENDELLNLRAKLQKKYSNLLGFGERMNWASLTEDLQIEILIRLPVKSLMRFKCVQRSWNILFKTPPFENKTRLHKSENGCAVNESINFMRYPKRRSWSKSKKSVAKMSHAAVIAEIQRGMNNAKSAYDLKTEMRFLEDVLICKVEHQKELAAKHQKDKAEIQKVRAALQKRIVEVQKQTAEVTKQQEKKLFEAKDEGNSK